jgi:hypothetical protein
MALSALTGSSNDGGPTPNGFPWRDSPPIGAGTESDPVVPGEPVPPDSTSDTPLAGSSSTGEGPSLDSLARRRGALGKSAPAPFVLALTMATGGVSLRSLW